MTAESGFRVMIVKIFQYFSISKKTYPDLIGSFLADGAERSGNVPSNHQGENLTAHRFFFHGSIWQRSPGLEERITISLQYIFTIC